MQATNACRACAWRRRRCSQGLMFAEMWIEQIAKTLGKPDHEIRQINMYKEGEKTHFGQVRSTASLRLPRVHPSLHTK